MRLYVLGMRRIVEGAGMLFGDVLGNVAYSEKTTSS